MIYSLGGYSLSPLRPPSLHLRSSRTSSLHPIAPPLSRISTLPIPSSDGRTLPPSLGTPPHTQASPAAPPSNPSSSPAQSTAKSGATTFRSPPSATRSTTRTGPSLGGSLSGRGRGFIRIQPSLSRKLTTVGRRGEGDRRRRRGRGRGRRGRSIGTTREGR